MPRKEIPCFEELRKPLSEYGFKSLYYKLIQILLRTVGNLSEGIRIGFKHGFDSGNIMNYIYENQAHGSLFVGEILDRAFLDQKTCRAFRAIKKIQKDFILNYLAEKGDRETFIVDLASGKADYIYDVLLETDSNVRVLLRDINQNTLQQSKNTAKNLGLTENIRFETRDALEIESLRRITPKPDLVIEVGLYGIIHDDEKIKNHLKSLKEILDPDALLFNVQTYNDQIELIARSLINQDGGPCVWHLRESEQLISWAEDAGFKNPEIVMDPYDIYAVIMMRG